MIIKPLYEYSDNIRRKLVINAFEENSEIYDEVNIDAIVIDFEKLIDELKISEDVELNRDFHWDDNFDFIDLKVGTATEYKDSWGDFFITWDKFNLHCRNICYSGYNEYEHENVSFTYENMEEEND